MKPENPTGVQGSRMTPVSAGGENRLTLSLEAQGTGGAMVLHCQGPARGRRYIPGR